MPHILRWLCLGWMVLPNGTGLCQENLMQADQELRLRNITLYSSGLGALNYVATIEAATVLELELPTQDVSDALRTLVVNDPKAPVAFVRTRMRPDLGRPTDLLPDTTSLVDLLTSLRGQPVRVEFRSGTEQSGRIVTLENSWESLDGVMVERIRISLLSSRGIESVLLEEVLRVECLEPATQSRITQALDRISSQTQASKSIIEIGFEANESREIQIGLLRPLPVWKCSYSLRDDTLTMRVVIDNATGDDWHEVALTINDGQPIAFAVDLDSPVRLKREQLALPLGLPGIPPMFAEGKLDSGRQRNARELTGGHFGAGGSGWGGMGGGMGGMGGSFGSASGYGGGDYATQGDATVEPLPFGLPGGLGLATRANLDSEVGIGERFSMRFDRVSLPANSTTVLTSPTLDVQVQRLSAFSEPYNSHTPLLAVKLVNLTEMLLPPGPTTIYSENHHVGEAMLPRLSPAAPRIIGYALDGAVKVDRLPSKESQRVTQLSFNDPRRTLHITTTKTRTERLAITNRASTDRRLSIEYATDDDSWSVQPTPGDQILDGTVRLIVPLDAMTETVREIVSIKLVQESFPYQDSPLDLLQKLKLEELIDAQARERLDELLTLRQEYETQKQSVSQLDAQYRQSQREIERLVRILTATGLLDDAKRRYLERIEVAEQKMSQLSQRLSQEQQELQTLQRKLAPEGM